MASLKTRSKFFGSLEASGIQDQLQEMVDSHAYNTPSYFSADKINYPEGKMPFLDKHMNYLNSHPSLDANMYLANLRLMCRLK